MTNPFKLIPTLIAAALVALCLPIMASAQGSYDPWNRNRDYRRDRRDDYDRYGQRALRDSIRRVRDRSDDFRDHLDRALDRSRLDDTRREDGINHLAREFERAANRLDDRYDNGRDLNRSVDEARHLLEVGSRIDQIMMRARLRDGRAQSDWAQIRQDLRVIANAYGSYDNRSGDWRRRNGNQRAIGEIFRNFPY